MKTKMPVLSPCPECFRWLFLLFFEFWKRHGPCNVCVKRVVLFSETSPARGYREMCWASSCSCKTRYQSRWHRVALRNLWLFGTLQNCTMDCPMLLFIHSCIFGYRASVNHNMTKVRGKQLVLPSTTFQPRIK